MVPVSGHAGHVTGGAPEQTFGLTSEWILKSESPNIAAIDLLGDFRTS